LQLRIFLCTRPQQTVCGRVYASYQNRRWETKNKACPQFLLTLRSMGKI
jgi:hypothetical protein